jgi:putative copper export protein
MPEAALALSLFFHIGATVIWIGGILLLTFLVAPELNRALANQPVWYQLLRRLRKRMTPLSNLSLAVLIVTGFLQMSADPNYEGLLSFNNRWSQALLIKHTLLIVMAAAGLTLQIVVAPALERTSLLLERGQGDAGEWNRLRLRERRLTLLIAALALLILAASAWLTAI